MPGVSFNRPNVAMVEEHQPQPGTLPTWSRNRETLPMTARSLTLTRSTFLSWKRVELPGLPGGRISGWVRSSYVMPLYETD